MEAVRAREQRHSGMKVLHIRLRGEAVALLKRRAILAGIAPAEYVELVLWYAALVCARIEEWADEPVPGATRELYFSTPLSDALRDHMVARSAEDQQNLAVFTGSLVEYYLARFERDGAPAELTAEHIGALLERLN